MILGMRQFNAMQRKRQMALLAIKLGKDDFAYSLSRELASMALDYMSVRDETQDYEPDMRVRQFIESARKMGLSMSAISSLLENK